MEVTGFGFGFDFGWEGANSPTVSFDFTTQTYTAGGVPVALTAIPGWTFTRASSGTALDSHGNIVSFGANQPRITDLGLLTEDSRTNSFLNSNVGTTQTVTTTAGSWTLSFYGTGSITLSGGATGTLSGTSSINRVFLVVTATAAPTTLTVTGSISLVQFETGGFPTSYIPTVGAAATRAIDIAFIMSLAPTASFSLTASFIINYSFIQNQWAGSMSDGTAANRAYFGGSGNNTVFSGLIVSGVAHTFTNLVNPTLGAKAAYRVAPNDYHMYVNGVLVDSSTSTGVPVSDRLSIACAFNGNTGQLNGYLRSISLYSYGLTNSQLQSFTQ